MGAGDKDTNKVLDYFVVSESSSNRIEIVEAIEGYVWKPHKTVRCEVALAQDADRKRVRQVLRR